MPNPTRICPTERQGPDYTYRLQKPAPAPVVVHFAKAPQRFVSLFREWRKRHRMKRAAGETKPACTEIRGPVTETTCGEAV